MILKLDLNDSKPIYQQIRDQIVLGIAKKEINLNEDLPSVRQLAGDIGINMHTVNKAYKILEQEGWVIINKKKGAFINPNLPNNNNEYLNQLKDQMKFIFAELHLRGVKYNELDLYLKSLLDEFKEDDYE